MVAKTKKRLIASAGVRHRFDGISDTTLANWIKNGKLPKPQRINGRMYWPEAIIDAVVEGRWQPDHFDA